MRGTTPISHFTLLVFWGNKKAYLPYEDRGEDSRYHPTLYLAVPIRNVNGRLLLLGSQQELSRDITPIAIHRFTPSTGSL